jgi:hypothetical protein
MKINWENCYFVQYKPGRNKKMIIPERGVRAIKKINHPKYNSYFYGAERGTPYGLVRLTDTTHWAVVDMTDPDNPQVIHADKYPDVGAVELIKTHTKEYIVLRGSNRYVKFYISEYSSYSEMRHKASRKES